MKKECSDIHRSWESPFSGHKESAQPVGGRSKDKLEFDIPSYLYPVFI